MSNEYKAAAKQVIQDFNIPNQKMADRIESELLLAYANGVSHGANLSGDACLECERLRNAK